MSFFKVLFSLLVPLRLTPQFFGNTNAINVTFNVLCKVIAFQLVSLGLTYFKFLSSSNEEIGFSTKSQLGSTGLLGPIG